MRMMTKILLLGFLFPAVAFAQDKPLTAPNNYAPPVMSMQHAVTKATQCLAEQKIDISNHYLKSANFERVSSVDFYLRKWQVTSDMKPMVRGGQTYVYVAEDGSCVVTFGE